MWKFWQKKAPFEKRFKVIFFDLGKTLLYFHGDSLQVFNLGKARLYDTLRMKLPGLDKTQFLEDFDRRIKEYYRERDDTYIEHTTSKILQKCLEDFGYLDVPTKLIRKALERMYSISEKRWRPAADTYACLKTLKHQGYRLGIISNAGDADNANRLIDRRNLRHYMDFVLISAEIGMRKPAPIIFQTAMDKIGAEPRDTVMVGDTLRADIMGAQALGIATVWITRQADSVQNSADRTVITPDASIKCLRELPAVLANWQNP